MAVKYLQETGFSTQENAQTQSPSESMCAESEFREAKRCGQEDKSVCMLYTAWGTVQLLSVAMTNTLAKSNLGEERIYLTCNSRS